MSLEYINLNKNELKENPRIGVCLLTHNKTGCVYIFSSRHIVRAIHNLSLRLESNKGRLKKLQELHAVSPDFTASYTFYLTEDEAYEAEQVYLNQYKDNELLINSLDDTDVNPGAYLLTHVKTGKVYAGSTNDLERRIREHMHWLKKGKHTNTELQSAYNDSIEITVKTFETETSQEALDIEQSYLDKHRDTGVLFNIATNARLSGDGIPTSNKQKESVKRVHTGKIVSAQTRQRLRYAQENRALSHDRIQQITLNSIGKEHKDAAKQKVSESKLGIPRSEETKAKLRALLLGRKLTEEEKEKRRLARMGPPLSPEEKKAKRALMAKNRAQLKRLTYVRSDEERATRRLQKQKRKLRLRLEKEQSQELPF